jgi:hypothetical protein
MALFDAYPKRFQAGNQAYQTWAGNGSNSLKSGTTQGVNALKAGQATGTAAINAGKQQGLGFLGQTIEPWEQLQGMGQQGIDAHFNLLQNPDSIYDSELYKSREAAGLEGLNRMANSRGMLSAGNNTQDILDYMRTGGLDYFNTLANQYQPYFGLGTSAAQGLSGVRGAQANMAYGAGSDLANLASNTGANTANLYGQQGRGLADIALARGDSAQGMNINMANAKSKADADMWGLILGLGNAASGGVGSYVGAGGRF